MLSWPTRSIILNRLRIIYFITPSCNAILLHLEISFKEKSIIFVVKELCIHNKSTIFTRIHYGSIIFLVNHYTFALCYGNSLWNHDFFANPQWICSLFYKFTMDSLSLLCIHYDFTKDFANSLSYTWIHHDFTICIANSLWNHYLFSYFANLQRIHYLFYDITMILLRISRIHCLFRELWWLRFFASEIHYWLTVFSLHQYKSTIVFA